MAERSDHYEFLLVYLRSKPRVVSSLTAATPNPLGRADGPAKPPIDVVMDDATGQEVFVPTPSKYREGRG